MGTPEKFDSSTEKKIAGSQQADKIMQMLSIRMKESFKTQIRKTIEDDMLTPEARQILLKTEK